MVRATLVAVIAVVVAGNPAVQKSPATQKSSAQKQAQGPAFKLEKAVVVDQVTNDQKRPIVAPNGNKLLWIKATALRTPQTIDLTKVEITGTPSKLPLFGVDSAFGGEPTQFSTIAAVRLRNGPLIQPVEETRSEGAVEFAFSPGKTATLTFKTGNPSVCFLFAVFPTFTTGQVVGLGPAPMPVPALSTGR